MPGNLVRSSLKVGESVVLSGWSIIENDRMRKMTSCRSLCNNTQRPSALVGMVWYQVTKDPNDGG